MLHRIIYAVIMQLAPFKKKGSSTYNPKATYKEDSPVKKFTKLLLALSLVICILLALPFNAGAASTQSKDGLEVSIKTDKEKYAADQNIQISVDIKNSTPFPVGDLSVELQLSKQLEVKGGSEIRTGISIESGATKTVSFSAMSDMEEKEDEKGSSLLIWIILSAGITLILAAVCIILVVKHKKAAKVMCLFLCVAMALSMIPTKASAAEGDTAITVDKTIKVEGEKQTIKATVTIPADALSPNSTVTFDTDGGSAVESQTVPKGATLTMPNAPEKEGFAFVGWYTDKEYSAVFDFETPVYKSCTLFARWVDVSDTTDTDGDGLTDPVEEYYKTNPTLPDTDSDGLTDYAEIAVFGYDPLNQDTDGNGVSDGLEDFDEDGIDNQTEVELGTDPALPDTDGDDLTDKAETATYRTDPTNRDTDNDGASDGKEVELGTDPLTAQSSFNMNISAKEDEKGGATPSVEINLSGEQIDTLSIQPVESKSFFPETMPGYMGMAYDFNVEGEFDTATIRFEFDASQLSAGADPVIYYFNEETQALEELATTVTGNVASATVTHFSKYILIDRTIHEECFIWTDVWDSTKNYSSAEIVLVIDDSGSLGGDYGYDASSGTFIGGKDPSHKRLEVSRDFVDSANPNAKIGIVKFDGVVDNITGNLVECTPQGKEQLKNLLKFTYKDDYSEYNISGIFDSRGYTYMYAGIEQAIDQFSNADEVMKVIVVFTDGEAHDAELHNSVVEKALRNDVKIYTVGLGTSSYYFNSYLTPLAANTGGAFYNADDAEQLADIYKNISQKIDIETDSDEDGVPDYYEDNMLCFNGVKLALDKNNPDTDGDGLKDGEEVELNYEYNADRTQVKVTGKLILGNPTAQDSDGDGYLDNEDFNPLHKYHTPVILVHGWTSNTACFGANTYIKEGDNSHYDHNYDGLTDNETISKLKYDDIGSHKITSISGGMLASYLMACGYSPNKDLYAFNYPNEDMVQYSASKLKAYIANLVAAAKNATNQDITDQHYLFATKEDYQNGNVKFILVGHSMGGLVSRYYVENLGGKYISKIITIDTPHYGSGLGNFSAAADGVATLMGKYNPGVYDLDTRSTLFGGNMKWIDFTSLIAYRASYYAINNQSPALKGNKNTSVKYYAVAGYDVGRVSEINQLAEGMKTDLQNGAFSVPFERSIKDKQSLKNAINNKLNELSIACYGQGSRLDLGDSDGDNTVDYMSQLAVRFGSNYDYQKLEKTTMIISTGYLPTSPYHNAIHYERLMHIAVKEFIDD